MIGHNRRVIDTGTRAIHQHCRLFFSLLPKMNIPHATRRHYACQDGSIDGRGAGDERCDRCLRRSQSFPESTSASGNSPTVEGMAEDDGTAGVDDGIGVVATAAAARLRKAETTEKRMLECIRCALAFPFFFFFFF